MERDHIYLHIKILAKKHDMDDLFLVRVYLTQHAVRPQQSLTVTNAAYTQRSNSSESCLEMEIKEEEEKLEILDIAT